jgi:O-antigen ligase
LLGYAALASLYWTESKTGWLLAMGLVFLIVLHLDFSRKVKIGLIIGLVILGVGAFSFKYADYFKRGATSVTARFDYWEAAWKTFKANPVLGTGPGTFKHAYARLKRPESEMARLAHNDYLEQASDSGLIGFLAFAGIFPYSLIRLHRKARQGGVVFAVWLGLVGWALQGLVEFSLYIPALAWPAFLLLGWLWGWEGNGGISAAKKTGAIKSATT